MFLLFFVVFQSRIVITEVMSNVRGSESGAGAPGDRNEFVEIYNNSSDTIDISSFFIFDFEEGVNPDSIMPWDDDAILVNYPSLRIHSTRVYPYSYMLILDREYTSTDTTGGNVQPYDIPDSTLILTTDDTSIGNGLAGNDPLIVYSVADACTTSFGTPYDTLDDFPSDPGDGISWERIEILEPDEVGNWHICMDSSGCTPGRENSTINVIDLAMESQSIVITPATIHVGENVGVEAWVKNQGLRPASDYELYIFDDQNHDRIMDQEEILTHMTGEPINPDDSMQFSYTYSNPSLGTHGLGFQLDCAYDNNLTNNLVFKDFQVVSDEGGLALSPRIITPNNDGIDDYLQIDYQVPGSGGLLSLLVFDTRGKLVHTLCKKETCMTAQGTLYWDGVSHGKKIPSGMYVVYLEYDHQGELTKAKKTAVIAR